MSAQATCAVVFDDRSLRWLREFNGRLCLLEKIVQRPVELVNLVGSLPSSAAAFEFKTLSASQAGQRRIILNPCEGLVWSKN
jgi:hypothetical protein